MTDQIQPVTSSSGLSDNSAGGLAYLTFIPAIIFLVMEPYNRNRFIKFHSWQSILLTGAVIAWDIVYVILTIVLRGTLGLGLLISLLGFVVGVGFFILWIIAIIQAFNGKKFSIPVIGAIAEKQANS
ncbi:DUF4870 domain-containing protein [Terracidiphilus gabretensis]|uniref:DUF4870 domain-containing protein n=1 Tax=Terracidiphilus gabretensis TaxID=1577687 RepID=UPI00071B85B7|nr:DUF4870 domain-containing protein [Terracidiphilus gabretensis]